MTALMMTAFAIVAAVQKDRPWWDKAGAALFGVIVIGAIAYRLIRERREKRAPKEAEVLGPTYEGPSLPPGELMRRVRGLVGPAPRDPRVHDFPLATPPAWMRLTPDALRGIYQDQAKLIVQGDVVWGHLLQANNALFEPGAEDLPAAAVYSPDPFYDARPDLLGEIASQLFDLKGTRPADPDLRPIARYLTDERERQQLIHIPAKLTGGRDVRLTTIMVPRRHLPDGHLRGGVFPLLVPPRGAEGWTMILPGQLWPPELVAEWRGTSGPATVLPPLP